MTDLTIQGFQLSEQGIGIEGAPTFAQFQGCMDFVLRTHKASGWWLVDLITYADSRPDWVQCIDAVVDSEYLTEGSVRQYRYLGKAIPPAQRVCGVPFGLHAELASLPVDERTPWLEQAKVEGWTQRELRQRVKVSKQPVAAPVDGLMRFRVAVVEPVWGPETGAELLRLPVGRYTLPDSVLFLWSPVGRLLDALDAVAEWGFDYQTAFVWNTVLSMPTNYLALQHEMLLVCTKGRCEPVDASRPSVQTFRRQSFQSGTPTEFLDLVTRMYPEGPYVGIGVLEGRVDWVLWSIRDPTQWEAVL